MADYPESHRDLLNGDVAALATVGRDGQPQVTAVWFLMDDDGELRLSLNTGRQKLRNPRERPECTPFILDLKNPYRSLEIRARAELAPDPDDAFAEKIGRKYSADLRSWDASDESRVVVTLHPTRVVATDLGGG
jgi:PPOX class probable F420-dependent enzyme